MILAEFDETASGGISAALRLGSPLPSGCARDGEVGAPRVLSLESAPALIGVVVRIVVDVGVSKRLGLVTPPGIVCA